MDIIEKNKKVFCLIELIFKRTIKQSIMTIFVFKKRHSIEIFFYSPHVQVSGNGEKEKKKNIAQK